MAQQDDCQQAAAAEAPVPCANNCGFFGNRTTMNLCSKCYRASAKLMEMELEISPPAAAPAAILPSPSSPSSSPPPHSSSSSPSSREETGSCPAAAAAVAVAATSAAIAAATSSPDRCSCCRRKVGMMGIKCRCGKVVCFPHRYPSEHGCEFDFQGQGRVAIAKANPVVIARKINKI